VATLADLLVHIGVDTRGVDKGTDNIRRKFKDAFKAVSDGAKGIAPAVGAFGSLIPVALAGGAAVASLGATLAAGGVAMGVFGAVAKSAMTEVSEAATQVETLEEKIGKYASQAKVAAKAGEDNTAILKKQADATRELQAHMASLPPDVRKATESMLQLKSDWQDFVDQNKPAVYGLMTQGYKTLGTAITQLQPFFDAGSQAAGRFIDKISGWINGGGLTRLAAVAGPALETLTGVIINTGTAIGRMFGKLGTKTGQSFLDWLEKATAKWAEWAGQAERGDGMAKMFETLSTQGPPLLQALKDIATAALNIAKAVAPLAPITLAVASALASLIAALPPDVITALVAAWIAYGIALKAWAIYQAIATAAQWAMNTALLANPITWIIIAIVALIAAIVLIATKTTWFQATWEAVWGFLKMVGGWIKTVFVGYFTLMWKTFMFVVKAIWAGLKLYFGFWYGLFNKVKGWAAAAVAFIWGKFKAFIAFLISVPGRVKARLSSMWDGMKNGFRAAINYIIGKWNSLQFTIPSFSILGKSFGGGSIGTPNIPQLAKGGIVKASPGGTLVNVGEGGHDEAVVPLGRGAQNVGRQDPPTVTLVIEGAETEFRRWLNKSIRVKGPVGRTVSA
jgi:hypothetical protein